MDSGLRPYDSLDNCYKNGRKIGSRHMDARTYDKLPVPILVLSLELYIYLFVLSWVADVKNM